jgi:ubiquinone/menaquinone biosynthesis C-methylase UbiE
VETVTGEYWNHNVHYQRVILEAVPDPCAAALDVGCGDGLLVRKLAGRCAAVTGIDRDGPILARARAHPGSPANASYVEGDFLAHPFGDGTFDFACANTSLHHMDFGAALAKLAGVLRPGGRLAVVGIARHASPADWAFDAAGIPVNRYYRLTRGESDPGAPIREPDMSWAQVRRAASRVLPGARYRRHLLWRYSLRWTKPG